MRYKTSPDVHLSGYILIFIYGIVYIFIIVVLYIYCLALNTQQKEKDLSTVLIIFDRGKRRWFQDLWSLPFEYSSDPNDVSCPCLFVFLCSHTIIANCYHWCCRVSRFATKCRSYKNTNNNIWCKWCFLPVSLMLTVCLCIHIFKKYIFLISDRGSCCICAVRLVSILSWFDQDGSFLSHERWCYFSLSVSASSKYLSYFCE